MSKNRLTLTNVILDSMNDGLYVCDKNRVIVYWSKSAERITGWQAHEVVGRRCSDGILCHVDKDGRSLCGKEFCPLHRSMVTDKASTVPLPVFGMTSSGYRKPMIVSVAPIHDDTGQVIGGVETFSDYSESFQDLERAQRIQTLSLEHDLPRDPRIAFSTGYVPHDVIGGDYVAIRALDRDRYGFLIADVMGHGVAAALYTMNLGGLWYRYGHEVEDPAAFAHRLNRELCRVVHDESFATALCGIVDAETRRVRIASAGGPSIAWFKSNGTVEQIVAPGLPFGMIEDADYLDVELSCNEGDSLLLFTDGAVEIHDAAGRMLGTNGLIELMKALDYPATDLRIERVQEAMLMFSNGIRLDDDLTLMDIRFRPAQGDDA